MTNTNHRRRAQLFEVLSLISERPQFQKREIQSLCQEAKPAFVTQILKQLAAEGVLASEHDAGDQRFYWRTAPDRFESHKWIDQQIFGNQVTQTPLEERPRERLLEGGVEQLRISDLLAILIRSGRKGESAVQAGQKIANQVQGDLTQLPRFSPAELKDISRVVSEVAYCQIMAGIELGRRVAEAISSTEIQEKLNSSQRAIDYCQRHFGRMALDARQEEFHIVTLDTKLRPIKRHRITVGTLDASLVHPREVFRAAIRDAASAILLVHNHPSGDPTPSPQDHAVTERLKQCGDTLGIMVVDHIIVAREVAISLTEWRP